MIKQAPSWQKLVLLWNTTTASSILWKNTKVDFDPALLMVLLYLWIVVVAVVPTTHKYGLRSVGILLFSQSRHNTVSPESQADPIDRNACGCSSISNSSSVGSVRVSSYNDSSPMMIVIWSMPKSGIGLILLGMILSSVMIMIENVLAG